MAYYKYDGSLARSTASPTTTYAGTSATETTTGTAGADSFSGGQGDTMVGGAGDDTYYVNSSRDVVVEYAGGGIDRISTWRNMSLVDKPHVENLSVGGDGFYAAGNALDNIMQGKEGAQQIYGGRGQDVLIGGLGADVFIVYKGEGNDVIQDFAVLEDKVRLKAGYTSFSEVQSHLTQVGADVVLDLGGGSGLLFRNLQVGQLTAANFQLQMDPRSLGALTFSDEFNALSLWDPVLAPNGVWRPDYGFQGENGIDSYTLTGNSEKQIYTSPFFRDHAGDFSESPFVINADGTLSIWARPSTNAELFGYGYTSGALTTKETFAQTYGYFEIRASAPHAAGTWPAFWLVPNDGSWPPELDVMEILGKDPNAAHTTVHSAVGGVHTQTSQMNYVPDTSDGMHTFGTLWTPTELVYFIDGVEVMRVPTPADMNKPMHLIVNMAVGGWGGTVEAGAIPAEFQIDYVRAYALPSATSVAGVTLTGGSSADQLTGQAGDDFLYGLAGSDTLTGGMGGDTLAGGAGNDTFHVDNARDLVVEMAAQGTDKIFSTVSLTLAANVEHLTLTGAAALNGAGNELTNALTGNGGANTLQGMGGADNLFGGAGNDSLDGGTGADKMSGQAGDDTYIVDAAGDLVTELASEGADAVRASVSHTMRANVETLVLTGTAAINAVGNTLSNTITGNDAANTINGGGGGDVLRGAGGADTFVFSLAKDSTPGLPDLVADFSSMDRLDLSALDASSLLLADQAFVRVIGDGTFTAAGQLRLVFDGTNTRLELNTDADRTAEMVILLAGNHTGSTATDGWLL